MLPLVQNQVGPVPIIQIRVSIASLAQLFKQIDAHSFRLLHDEIVVMRIGTDRRVTPEVIVWGAGRARRKGLDSWQQRMRVQ